MSADPLSLRFIAQHPEDAARTLEALDAAELSEFIDRLPVVEAAAVINQLLPQTAARCLSLQQPKAGAAILAQLDVDTAASLLRRVGVSTQAGLLAGVPAGRAAAIRLVMRFPDAVVGSIMDPGIPVVGEDMRVCDAVAAVRSYGDRPLDQLYVINAAGQLAGSVEFKTLLVSDQDARIQDLAGRVEHVFSARASLANIRDDEAWRFVRSVPVVDRSGVLLGVVTQDGANQALHSIGRGVGQQQEDVADLMFSFVETIWGACAELFVHDEGPGRGRDRTAE